MHTPLTKIIADLEKLAREYDSLDKEMNMGHDLVGNYNKRKDIIGCIGLCNNKIKNFIERENTQARHRHDVVAKAINGNM